MSSFLRRRDHDQRTTTRPSFFIAFRCRGCRAGGKTSFGRDVFFSQPGGISISFSLSLLFQHLQNPQKSPRHDESRSESHHQQGDDDSGCNSSVTTEEDILELYQDFRVSPIFGLAGSTHVSALGVSETPSFLSIEKCTSKNYWLRKFQLLFFF